MRSIVIGAVVALAIAGGAYLWLDNKGGTSHGEDAAVDKHSLVVELAAPVKTKLEKTSTGNPIGYNPKMVSVTVTLRFADEAALGKARGEIRQLRRAYSNAISKKIEGYRWQSFTPPAAGKSRRFRGLICHRRSHSSTSSKRNSMQHLISTMIRISG